MILPKNLLVILAFFISMTILLSACGTTEEIVEEEPEPEPEVEEVVEPEPEPTPPEPEPEPEPVEIPDLDNVYFGFDLSNLNSEAESVMGRNLEKLLDLPSDYVVSIDAYTDHIGGDQYNLRLSYRRANTVVQYLTDNGISVDRIESRGRGKAPVPCYDQYPDDPGCPDNRRAEFRVIEPQRAPTQR